MGEHFLCHLRILSSFEFYGKEIMPFTCSFVGWTTYSNTSTSSRVCQGVQQIVYKVLFDDVHNLFATKIALENAHCSTQLAALPGPPNGHYQIRNSQAWQIFSGITSWALERTWHFKQWFRSAAVEQLKSGSRRAQIFVAWWSGGGDWAREIAVVTIQIGVKRCIIDRSSVELSTYCAVVGWSDWNCSFVQKASDWKKAEKVRESGMIHLGRIDACNSGGLLVRFGSLQGFLPFSQMDSARIPKGACWSLLKEVVVLTILENPEHLEVQV